MMGRKFSLPFPPTNHLHRPPAATPICFPREVSHILYAQRLNPPLVHACAKYFGLIIYLLAAAVVLSTPLIPPHQVITKQN